MIPLQAEGPGDSRREQSETPPPVKRPTENWDEERRVNEYHARENCGWCCHRIFMLDSPGEYEWLLCLAEQSSYWLETLHATFSCPYQEPRQRQPKEPPPFPGLYDGTQPLNRG